MSEPDRPAAEVRGAYLALNGTRMGTLGLPQQGSAITVCSPIGPDADRLLEEIAAADKVDIVGTLPWQCAARLMEITSRRQLDNQPVVQPADVRYFTPARNRITIYRNADALGTLVQRWIAGVSGVRNWLRPLRATEPVTRHLLYEFNDVYLDCLIHVFSNGRHQVIAFNQLPRMKTTITNDTGAAETTLLITRMPDDQVRLFGVYLDSLAAEAKPLVSREMLCRLDDSGLHSAPEGAEFRPLISTLAPYDSARLPHTIVPVTVVVILAPTAHGTSVVLKRRAQWNSREDFNTLSLISERILEEDFPGAMSNPLNPDIDRAMDELWIRAGSPTTFEIPSSAFLRAAQRELFMSCGLDIGEGRLKLHGTCLLDREGENSYLGFYVYSVKLNRSAEIDELAHALVWNPDLEIVRLNELYSDDYRPRLNRLLRRRDKWLQREVFGAATKRSANVEEHAN